MMSLQRAAGFVTRAPRPSLAQPCRAASQVRWLASRPNLRSSTGRRGGGGGGGGGIGMAPTMAVFFLTGAGFYAFVTQSSDSTPAGRKMNKDGLVEGQYTYVIPKAEVEFESAVTTTVPSEGSNNDDVREALSPQHRQIKHSIEHPGVYAWGSNAGRVVAPESAEAMVREPRRLSFFDGQVLRDLKLDKDIGVAVTEQGDVVQWGLGFWGAEAVPAAPVWAKLAKGSKAAQPSPPTVPLEPAVTLKGKNIVKVALSNDRVLALAANGTVYSIPQAMQGLNLNLKTESKDLTGSGIRTSMTPTGLGWGERVVDLCSGQEHCLMRTNKGRVFSAVASFSSFPARGQLGVPGLTWETRSTDRPLDAAYEVPGLRGVSAEQIATGDYHGLVLAQDNDHTLYSFGDNSTGQLCVPASLGTQYSANPIKVPVQKLYEPVSDGTPLGNNNAALQRQNQPTARVTSIAAGGATSFFTVDVTPRQEQKAPQNVTVDTWACGSGIYGMLGTGKWVHISTAGPGKIRALSGLAEYSEAARATVPIRLAHIAAGATHAMAVLQNATHVASEKNKSDTNWGFDTLWWGGNEYYQLGTGKRSNQSEPVHIAPLDAVGAVAGASSSSSSALAAKTRGQPAGVTADPELTRERLILTPRTRVRLPDGHKVDMEQRATCGRYVSGVYCACS